MTDPTKKKNPLKVTDTFTGKQTEFPSYDAWMASMDGKKTSAEKTADRIISDTKTADKFSSMETVATTTIEQRKFGNTPSTFSSKDFEKTANGSGKTLDQASKEFAEKEAYSPTGVWEFDLGYAAARARKKKIEAAGGKEAFKSGRRMKRDQAVMRGIGKVQSALGVGDYGKDKKQQRKDLKQQGKDLKQKITGIKTEVTKRPGIDLGNVTNKKEVKGLPTKSKYGF